MIYGEGISWELDRDLAESMKRENSGVWFSYNGDQLGQGRENVRMLLKGKPELLEEIGAKVREAAARESGLELSFGESRTAGTGEASPSGFEPYPGD